MKRATMTDVARLAGVSQGTVSIVLNEVANARIAKATRQRIVEAARSLGYTKGLRHSVGAAPTRVIGLLIDEIASTPFFPPFVDGAQAEADEADCVIAMFRTRRDAASEAVAIEMLRTPRLAGIIYTTLIRQVVELPASLQGIPTVLLNCSTTKGGELSVIPADVAGAYAATEVLLKAGHRRVAHLADHPMVVAGRDREAGYRQALTNWDIAIDRSLIKSTPWSLRQGREQMHSLLALPNPPTGIFCYNDRMAAGAYEAIKERGLRIPEDVSVIGYDNELTLAERLDPPLTSMLLPHEEMGRLAVQMLLDYENVIASNRWPRMRKVECPLVMRSSVAPPPR